MQRLCEHVIDDARTFADVRLALAARDGLPDHAMLAELHRKVWPVPAFVGCAVFRVSSPADVDTPK